MAQRPFPFRLESRQISKRPGSIRRWRVEGIGCGWALSTRLSVPGAAATDVASCGGRVWDGGLGHRGNEHVGLTGGEGKKLKHGPRKGWLWRVSQQPTSISRCASFPHRFEGSRVFISL